MQLKRFLSRRGPALTVRSLRRGFTMMEILVVLAILGLLVALAVANLDTIFGNAQGTAAKLFVRDSLKNPLFTYRMQMGDYPSTTDGLQALLAPPAGKTDRWSGPYLLDGKLPLDPWNEPYQYANPGTRNKTGYDLWSKGPDKQSGTADDIGNWDVVATPTENK